VGRLATAEREIERGEALLSIEDEPIRTGEITHLNSLERPSFEAHLVSSALQEHHSSNRIRERYAGDQLPDVVIVPDPATLKVGKLN
jgi:hypothetical protein